MIDAPKPGIYPGVPFDVYKEWDAVNNSLLTVIDTKSPAHAKEYRDNPREQTQAMREGEIFHTMVLEPDLFNDRYAISPVFNKRTKQGKADYEQWLTDIGDKKEVSQDEVDLAKNLLEGIRRHSGAKTYLDEGVAEVCIVWIDKITGILCKARLDLVHKAFSVIVDVKKILDASPDGFAKSLHNYRYYQQSAFYHDGMVALTKHEWSFVFVPVEKSPPFCAAVYEVNDPTLLAGRRAYQRALRKIKKCMALDEWPGYSEAEMLDLPEWALKREGVVPEAVL